MRPWLALPAFVLCCSAARVSNPGFPAGGLELAPGPLFERKDLSPYFTRGEEAEAKAAFDQGKYARCRELLAGKKAPPARFLRALAAEKGMLLAQAAEEFEAVASDYPQVRDHCLLHAGQSYEGLKRWEDAERVYRQVSGQVRIVVDARLGLARARGALKRTKGAMEALAGLADRSAPGWGRDVAAEALWIEAEVLTASGDKARAKAALSKLWSQHPLSKHAQWAAERLGGELSKMPESVVIERGETLIDAHHNAQGEALLAKWWVGAKRPDALACRAGLAIGKAQRKLRRHQVAIRTLVDVVKSCTQPDIRLRALYTLGTSQSYVEPESAAGTFETLAAEAKEHSLGDDALLLAAQAHLKQGERAAAVDRLYELADRFPEGDAVADGLFELFWLVRSEAKLEEAVAILIEIEGRFGATDDSFERERARYWRGRVLEESGWRDEAISLYESVSREHPATYYGLISRERVESIDPERGQQLLAANAAPVESDDPLPLSLGKMAGDRQFLAAVELIRLGLKEGLPVEILAVDRSKASVEQVRLLVLLLSEAGEERAAHALARVWLRADLSGPIKRDRRALWEIAYPKAFRDLVEVRAKEADDLDPDLLQALMREESALDPRALSWAGALGLCQLMPATAAEVAQKLKLARPSREGLFDPDLNIRLGGRYLADLLRRARGKTQFALAGYNAGESAVARWRRDLGDEDLAAWVESIPVQETRGYVRRVLRSYAAYKLLYDPVRAPRTMWQVSEKPKPPKT